MTLDLWTILFLLLVSNIFWAYTTHKLVNKLMSQSFYDYQQTKHAFKKPKPPPPAPDVPQGPEDPTGQADTLNKLMGMS